MIQQQTILKISDNSGGKTAKCIKVLGKLKQKYNNVGDITILSIKKIRKNRNKKVNKGEVYKALILRTKKKIFKKDGSLIFFKNNSVCLLNKQGKPVSNRILGPIPKKIKNKKIMKLLNISAGFV